MAINKRLPVMWHGGDYNPDQWPAAIREDDVRQMRLSGMNVLSVGVFAWSQLEPRAGQFEWGWLDETFARFAENGLCVALATPSAAPPRWLVAAHPETMAVDQHGTRRHFGTRQHFCPTAPAYREHVRRVDRALADRYGTHPNLVLWHVSNEYATDCYCDLCAAEFRTWLTARYGDLETLNEQWWAYFWSHAVGSWEEIIPPFQDCGVVPEGLRLDWKRFRSYQMCDFFAMEANLLRSITPDVPLTTNLMGTFPGLDYAPFADIMDVISWDSYPLMTTDPARTAFNHALMRGLKDNKPWLLLEQTPSATNWQEFPTLKAPGVFRLWSWQAFGHGSDASMYFQWRASRGGHEKFHGAVVTHDGTENTRVFREVAALGEEMAKVSSVLVGTAPVKARVGVLWDQQNRWALEGSCGPGRDKRVVETAAKHYKAAAAHGVAVDVVRMDTDWSQYDVLIAPVMYMIKSGRFPRTASEMEAPGRVDEAAKLDAWVRGGGTLVATYLTGIVNENDYVYAGGFPGPLRELLGVWAEEIDVRAAGEKNRIVATAAAHTGMAAHEYTCERYFDLVHAEDAEALACYGDGWYAGRPCLTRAVRGKGRAYYVATDAEDAFLRDLYRAVGAEQGVAPEVEAPEGVEVLVREGEGRRLVFLLNHGAEPARVALGAVRGLDLLTGEAREGEVLLDGHGVVVVSCAP